MLGMRKEVIRLNNCKDDLEGMLEIVVESKRVAAEERWLKFMAKVIEEGTRKIAATSRRVLRKTMY